tara:strand:+ start:570 stop:1031 length:462 start_codon:yes stop_codon:yes gene_type:complete
MPLTKVRAGGFAAGAVIQTQTYTTATAVALSSSYQDIISCAITPSNSSSKMLITVYAPFVYPASKGIAVILLRGSTEIYNPNGIDSSGNSYLHFSDSSIYGSVALSYLDTHGSSSALTYKLQAKEYVSGTQSMPHDGNQADATLSVTIQEISG